MTRREMLRQCASGFGAVALATLLADKASAEENRPSSIVHRPSSRSPHFKAKARSVIFLYMDGGPSQVDTFDPKPRLAKEHGQPIKAQVQPTQFDDVGAVLKSPWEFQQYGQSGIPVSGLFPHVAQCVDDLAIIRSMVQPGRGVKYTKQLKSWTDEVWEMYERVTGRPRPEFFAQHSPSLKKKPEVAACTATASVIP